MRPRFMKRAIERDEDYPAARRRGDAQDGPEREASETGERIEDRLQRFGLVSGSPNLLRGKGEPGSGVRAPVRARQQPLP